MGTNFTTPRCGPLVKGRSAVVTYAKYIRRTAVLVSISIVSTAFLVGCKGVDLATLRQENAALVMSMYRAKPLEAVNNGSVEISLHDCVRIALSTGLDLQAVIWDEQVKTRLAKASLIRTMPRVWGLYNISQRNGVQFSRSDVIGQEGAYEVYGPGPGTGVTNYSTGRESFTRTSQIQIDWSPMDACMAKYISDMRYNEALQSKYQRVRVAQQMVGTVTAAFYRLLALELAYGKAHALEGRRSAIVRDLKNSSSTV